MNDSPDSPNADAAAHDRADDSYQKAIASIEQTISRFRHCSEEEKERLRQDLVQLEAMSEKLTAGRIEIVLFGEIDTGKSALINALAGAEVAPVDVRGGWTKEVGKFSWEGCTYRLPGLRDSHVAIIDTPGINEVGGEERAALAREAASQADLILFVVDSDINETEFSALTLIASLHKPILVVFNKIDLYSRADRERILQVLRHERLVDLVPPERIIPAAARPREVEYVIVSPDGSERFEKRQAPCDIEGVKGAILKVLEESGKELAALNAALFAADKDERIASLRVQLRDANARKIIWSYAIVKAATVSLNPVPGLDVVGGSAVDIAMVVTLGRLYGLEYSWFNARKLVGSILGAAGLSLAGEFATHALAAVVKGMSFGYATALTAVPQAAAAGFGSYIVGLAAKYYFEHGAGWGGEAPKAVVRRILEQTDKHSVLENLKDEIRKRLQFNPHAEKK